MPDNKNFYKDIIDNLYDGVYFVDRDRVITYWNKGAERITGYSAAQTIGHACHDNLLNHVTSDGVQLCQDHCPLKAVMHDGKEREVEVFLHHAAGHRLPVIVRAAALRDGEGNIIGAIESFSNNISMSSARRDLRALHHAAMTDGRWGGEEFIAILPDIRHENGLRIAAEKIRTLVECSRLDVIQQHLTVTISMGGTLLLQGDTHDSFVGRADELLYRSKAAGRNWVSIG